MGRHVYSIVYGLQVVGLVEKSSLMILFQTVHTYFWSTITLSSI